MQNPIEFKLIRDFKCKRCGCTNYDKLMYTGIKTLEEINAIIEERYVCRNCDFPVDITDYLKNHIESLSMLPSELIEQSKFIDEGTEVRVNNEIINMEDE